MLRLRLLLWLLAAFNCTCNYQLKGGGLGDLTSAEEAHQQQIYHIFFLVIRLPTLQS